MKHPACETEKSSAADASVKASGKRLTVKLDGPEGAYAQQRLIFVAFGAEQRGLEARFFVYGGG
jgi:hypothetical protein